MKEHGSKPVGRRKSTVEAPSVQLREKVAEASNVSKGQFESVHRQGKNGETGTQEETGFPARRRDVSRQILPDGTRTCAQDKAETRLVCPGNVSRPCGFQKSVYKQKIDVASRFEDKFPRRQQVCHENTSGVERKLLQRVNSKVESSSNQHCLLERPASRTSCEATNLRSTAHERNIQQDPSQRRPHHEKHLTGKAVQQKTKQDETLKTCARQPQDHHQKPQQTCRAKSKKTEQTLKNGLMSESLSSADTHDNILGRLHTTNSQDKRAGIHNGLSSQQAISLQCLLGDDTDIEDRFESHRHPVQEFRDRVSAHSQRNHASETYGLHERAPLQRHLSERLASAHEHEKKLIQRQQYLQEKVRSRKMLLGSVIPSDVTFASEACRNWSATMISHRFREEKSYKHMILSADSGVSMGEGSSASRRNSETETDDQTKDDLPTIIAEMGEILNRRVPTKCQKCQRNRCEMKDASSQHSHPPSETESPPSSPFTESISSAEIESTAVDVMSPPPRNRVYQCRVIRDKNTYGTMFYPVYRMYLERDGRPEVLLLTARKRKKCSTSKYVICIGNDELRRKSSSLVGKLRSNLVGTRFHLATYVKGPEHSDDDSRPGSPLKFDSLLLFYETNFLGTKGPRRMKVFLPEVGRADDRLNLLERVRDGSMDGVLSLVNKEPEWDRETLSHILYFEGRVTKSSVKNFQLVEPPDGSSVLLQFGKVGRNEFTLDYHPPINAVQAFAIALSSFDGKIACE